MKQFLALLLVGTLTFTPIDAALLESEESSIIQNEEDADLENLDESSENFIEEITEEADKAVEVATPVDADDIAIENATPVDAEMECIEVDLSDYIVQAGGLKDISELVDIEKVNEEIYGNPEGEGLPCNNASGAEAAILNAYKNFAPSVDVSAYNLNFDVASTMVANILASNPRLFYANSGAMYWSMGGIITTIELKYNSSPAQAKAMLADYDDAMEEFRENIDPNWCDLEKILYANTWITQRCDYETTISKPHIYDAYGVFVNREAVCQGYAIAMIELCNQLGLESAMVVSFNLNHAWNLVKINGKIYHIDTTWNDPIGTIETHYSYHHFFLNSTKQFTTPNGAPGTGSRSHVNISNDWRVQVRNWKYQNATDETYDDPSAFAWSDTRLNKGIYPGTNHTWYGSTYYYKTSSNQLVSMKCDCTNNSFVKDAVVKDFGYFYANKEMTKVDGYNDLIMASFSTYSFIDFYDGIYRLDRTTGTVEPYHMLTAEEKEVGFIYDMYIIDNILYYGLDTQVEKAGHVELKSIDVAAGPYVNGSHKVTIHPENGEPEYDLYMVYGKRFTEAYDLSGSAYPLTAPTRSYYKFEGWSYDKNPDTRLYANDAKFRRLGSCDLYANYTPVYYTATLNYNGGKLVKDSTGLTATTLKNVVGDKPIFDSTNNLRKMPVLEKAGYNFDGWYTALVGGEKVLSTTSMADLSLSTNFTLYARFSPIVVTVALDKNLEGASLSQATMKVKYGEVYGDLPVPTCDGYTFIGWFTDAEAGTKVLSTTKSLAVEDINIFAHWTENTYTLRLHSNNDKDKVLVTYKLKYTDKQTLPKLEDYHLTYSIGNATGKWNTKADGSGEKIADQAEVSRLAKVNGAVVDLYAEWVLPSYTVKFLIGDETAGSGIVSDGFESVYNYTDSLTLSGKEFLKKGYSISNWKLSSTSEDAKKTKDATLKNGTYTRISKNDGELLTITANWVKNTYKVTYTLNGGAYVKGAPKGTASYTVETPEDTLVLPTAESLTRAGYTFAGWYDNKNFEGTPVTSLAITVDTPVKQTLFAKWTPITYTIKLDANGGLAGQKAIDATATVKYDEAYALTKNDYTRPGFTFTGYKTEIAGKAKNIKFSNVKGLTTTTGETIVLVAQWKPINYSITYKLNGGKNNKAKSKYASGTSLEINNPTKKGYTFTGWTLSMKDLSAATAEIAPTEDGLACTLSSGSYGNIVLEANWAPITYKVRFNVNRTEGLKSETAPIVVNTTYDQLLDIFQNQAIEFERALVADAENPSISAFTTLENGKGTKYTLNLQYKNLKSESGQELDLYAVWGPKTYQIYYALDEGGSISKAPTNFKEGTVPKIPTPVRAGYTFAGWENPITKDTKSDVNLIAKWTTNQFTVKYNANAKDAKKTNAPTSVKATYATSQIPVNPYTRVGYEFIGFNTKANGTGDFINDLGSLTAKNKGTVNLYAIWHADEYTITYSGIVSGDVNKNPETCVYGKAVKLAAPVRPGYTFLGFTLVGNNNGQSVSIKAKTNYVASINANNQANIKLLANWQENAYTLKINSNAGVNVNTNKAETVAYELADESGQRTTLIPYSKGINVTTYTNRFAKKGYVFVGFATDKKGKNMLESNTVSMLSAKNKAVVTLYAIWDKVSPVTPTVTASSSAAKKLDVAIKGNPLNGTPSYKIYYAPESAGMSFRNVTPVITMDTAASLTLPSSGNYFVKVVEVKTDSLGNELESKPSEIIKVTVQ